MLLFIGCGNRLRRDDGAGLVLVRRVSRRLRGAGLRTILCHQLTPELAPTLADADVAGVFFADAADPATAGDGPLLRPIAKPAAHPPLGHHLTPVSLLALSEELYGTRPPAWLASIPAADFTFGHRLSPTARRGIIAAEGEILKLLERKWPLMSASLRRSLFPVLTAPTPSRR